MKTIIIKQSILIILSLFLFPVSSYSQVSNNLIRYWYYRNRLNNYFVVPGEKWGESQVICIRNVIPDWVHSSTNQKNVDYGQHGKYTGLYIGTLATEYYLLNKNGQYEDAAKTQNEELQNKINSIKN